MTFFSTACNRLFYYPDKTIRTTPDVSNVDYEDVYFDTADGSRLHGWFMPAIGEATGTVLHLHGNAANITGHWPFVGWLPQAGFNVLTFDYRGYGQSQGHVTRAGTIEDGLAALTYLQGREDVKPDRIVVFGQSIGGSIAAVMAARETKSLRGLILDGAFSSYRKIARHHVFHNPGLAFVAWWYPLTIDDEYSPLEAIGSIENLPKLFIHGDADHVVPVAMAHELFEVAKEPKQIWIIPGGDHYSIWRDDGDEAKRRVIAFLKKCLAE